MTKNLYTTLEMFRYILTISCTKKKLGKFKTNVSSTIASKDVQHIPMFQYLLTLKLGKLKTNVSSTIATKDIPYHQANLQYWQQGRSCDHCI